MIVISPEMVKRILEHARREVPREACGILVGEIKDEKIVREIYPCKNIDTFPETNYTIKPRDILEVMDKADEKGLEILGFYHSHPAGGTQPSIIDKIRASWPGASYVIVSVPDGSISSWVLDEDSGEFEKEGIAIE
jgi:proteasome lid subunit RPN8/RPN11